MKKNQWFPTQSSWTWWGLLGLSIGAMVLGLGLGRGFHEQFDEGIQSLETAQVQFRSTTGVFGESFMLRALLRGKTGVESVSPRLEFPSRVRNARGETKTIVIRGVNFSQENEVTLFKHRIRNGVSGPIAGLLIPESWQWGQFLSPSGQGSILSEAGRASVVNVTGIYKGSLGPGGTEVAVLDLETARSVVGIPDATSSFVIRLRPGFDPDRWIQDNSESVRGYPGQFQTWKAISGPLWDRVIAEAIPLFVFRDAVVGLAALFCLGAGFWSWKTRTVVFLFRREPQSLWLGNLLGAAVGLVLGWGGLTLLLVFWAPWTSGSLGSLYPLSIPTRMLWGWGAEELIIAVVAALIATGPSVFWLLGGGNRVQSD